MRCDCCKYWSERDGYEKVKGGSIRHCTKVVMFWDATAWDSDGERVLLPDLTGQKSFVQDGSDYSASLLTTADFFCAHFENI